MDTNIDERLLALTGQTFAALSNLLKAIQAEGGGSGHLLKLQNPSLCTIIARQIVRLGSYTLAPQVITVYRNLPPLNLIECGIYQKVHGAIRKALEEDQTPTAPSAAETLHLYSPGVEVESSEVDAVALGNNLGHADTFQFLSLALSDEFLANVKTEANFVSLGPRIPVPSHPDQLLHLRVLRDGDKLRKYLKLTPYGQQWSRSVLFLLSPLT